MIKMGSSKVVTKNVPGWKISITKEVYGYIEFTKKECPTYEDAIKAADEQMLYDTYGGVDWDDVPAKIEITKTQEVYIDRYFKRCPSCRVAYDYDFDDHKEQIRLINEFDFCKTCFEKKEGGDQND